MLKLLSLRQEVLARWAVIGLLILLCAPWVLPSSKLYHQLTAVFLWLPALLALFHNDFRARLRQPEILLFAALALWTLLVLLVQGAAEPQSKVKLPFYVALSLLGVMLAALDVRWSLESLLRLCVWLGGLGAAASTLYYFGAGPAPGQRLIALGLWDTAIMAAHAVGALSLLGVFLYIRPINKPALSVSLALVALAYVVFLGLNHTRGVWLALFVALIFLLLAKPTRKGFLVILLMLVGVAALAIVEPQSIVARGVSYRPTLWMGGIQLFSDNWLLGLGFKPYEIAVPAIHVSFKHPHNLFLDIAVRLGLPGLMLFSLLWLATLWRAWLNRGEPLGRALLALWTFASVALLTDGIGLWLKPNADWLITWLPIALGMVLAMRCAAVNVEDKSER